MTLSEFIKELKKPRDKRKWIPKDEYKRLLMEYRLSPDVRENMNANNYSKTTQLKSRLYRRR